LTIYLLFLIFLLTKIRWHCKMKTIIVDIIINHANPRPPSEPSWSWSYGSWIYNYLCNQFLSPLIVLHMWVRKPVMAMCTRYNNIKFPHLDSNIPAPPACEVFISQLINNATFEFRLFTMLQYSNKLLSHRDFYRIVSSYLSKSFSEDINTLLKSILWVAYRWREMVFQSWLLFHYYVLQWPCILSNI
jgi:hypothetical protein